MHQYIMGEKAKMITPKMKKNLFHLSSLFEVKAKHSSICNDVHCQRFDFCMNIQFILQSLSPSVLIN